MLPREHEPSRPALVTREARFNRLYEEHVEAVRRYLWRRDPSLCEEVLAETFLVAWRRLESVPDDARPWLIGVARNVRLNLRRSAQRQRALATRLRETVEVRAQFDPAVESELVRTALESLREPDREVLLLSLWEGLDRTAIACVLGCSTANVSVRLHRARRRVARAIRELSSGDSERAPASRLTEGSTDVC